MDSDYAYIAFVLLVTIFGATGWKLFRKANKRANDAYEVAVANLFAGPPEPEGDEYVRGFRRAAGRIAHQIENGANMTADELRTKIMVKLDGLLGHRLLVHGEDRVLLQAFRDWIPEMAVEQLERVIVLMQGK